MGALSDLAIAMIVILVVLVVVVIVVPIAVIYGTSSSQPYPFAGTYLKQTATDDRYDFPGDFIIEMKINFTSEIPANSFFVFLGKFDTFGVADFFFGAGSDGTNSGMESYINQDPDTVFFLDNLSVLGNNTWKFQKTNNVLSIYKNSVFLGSSVYTGTPALLSGILQINGPVVDSSAAVTNWQGTVSWLKITKGTTLVGNFNFIKGKTEFPNLVSGSTDKFVETLV